jgi:tetratricopeptide (TPR) repeat protein/predicted Ser/Thr protein kinase
MNGDALDLAKQLARLDAATRAARLAALRERDSGLALRIDGLLAELSAETEAGAGVGVEAVPETPVRIGRYRIEGTLGEGGMGTVYLARQDQPDREVALKIIRAGRGDSEALARFRMEAELLAQLEHPGIARIHDAGSAEVGGRSLPWLAMEYVRGPHLLEHAERQSLGREARIGLVIELCRAVQHAHVRGVIHRDLKPQNVLVDPHGQPKILDFGVARARGAESAGMTRAGQVVGTLGYMSPEQLAGEAAQADARADVYALGVIAYQLLCGRLPYPDLTRISLVEALDRIRRSDPEPLGRVAPELSGDIETVVMKALAVEPAARYHSAAALADDLQRILDHRPIEARAPTAAYLLGRFARRHRLLVGAGAAVLLALVGAVVVSLHFAIAESAARQAAEQRRLEAEAVTAFLSGMIAQAAPERALGREVSVLEVLDAAAVEVDGGALPPPVQAAIRRSLGGSYHALGRYREAAAQQRALLPLMPATSPERWLAERDLARALVDAGEFEEARSLLAALEHPDLDPERRTMLDVSLARLAEDQGETGEAIAHYRSALARVGQGIDAHAEIVQAARLNLANLLSAAGELEEAGALLELLLARRLDEHGPDHPRTLSVQHGIAHLHQRAGRTQAAEALYADTLERRRRVLGDRHAQTLATLQSYAALLSTDGRAAEAEPLMREAALAMRELFGTGLPDTRRTLGTLAVVYEDLGRHDEAEVLYREIIAAQDAQGERGTEVAITHNNLGMLLMSGARLPQARTAFERALAEAESAAGEAHPVTAILRGNLGECLARMGETQAARESLSAALSTLNGAFGAEHPRTRKVADILAALPGG